MSKKALVTLFVVVISMSAIIAGGVMTLIGGGILDIFFIMYPIYFFMLFICYSLIGGHWVFTKPYARALLAGSLTTYDNCNQFYLSGVTSKKVVLSNIGNYFTEYKAVRDYSKYLKRFEIKCVKKTKKKNYYGATFVWNIILTFSEIPKNGHIIIVNKRCDVGDDVNGDKLVHVRCV